MRLHSSFFDIYVIRMSYLSVPHNCIHFALETTPNDEIKTKTGTQEYEIHGHTEWWENFPSRNIDRQKFIHDDFKQHLSSKEKAYRCIEICICSLNQFTDKQRTLLVTFALATRWPLVRSHTYTVLSSWLPKLTKYRADGLNRTATTRKWCPENSANWVPSATFHSRTIGWCPDWWRCVFVENGG